MKGAREACQGRSHCRRRHGAAIVRNLVHCGLIMKQANVAAIIRRQLMMRALDTALRAVVVACSSGRPINRGIRYVVGIVGDVIPVAPQEVVVLLLGGVGGAGCSRQLIRSQERKI